MFTIAGFKVTILKDKIVAFDGKVTCVFKSLDQMLKILIK